MKKSCACPTTKKLTLNSIRKFSRSFTLAEIVQARMYLMEMSGRSIGREASEVTDVNYTHVKLDRQGYDSNGRYFGAGSKLFSFEAGSTIANGSTLYFRSYDRSSARKILAKAFPSAKITYSAAS